MRQLKLASALIVAATVSLLLAACGGSGQKPAHRSSRASANSNGIKFSKCMRSHGLSNFPDLIPNQGLPIQHEADGSVDLILNGTLKPISGPAYNTALGACAKYIFVGESVGTGAAGNVQRMLVETAACFRRNGVTNYPDPPAIGSVHVGHMSPTGRALSAGINVDSPAFKAALGKCGSIMSRALNGG